MGFIRESVYLVFICLFFFCFSLCRVCTAVRANSGFPMETGRECSIVMLWISLAQHEKLNFVVMDSEPAEVGSV